VRLVADANVLLSAALGGRARAVLEHPQIAEILTAEATLTEVQEYAAQLAVKKHLSLDIVLMAVTTLPINIVQREVYEKTIAEARRRIGRRDPDDVEILALAIHTGLPLWSNDNDFDDAGIEWYTTAELLARLSSGPLTKPLTKRIHAIRKLVAYRGARTRLVRAASRLSLRLFVIYTISEASIETNLDAAGQGPAPSMSTNGPALFLCRRR
jgi:predicted nucleic acid-binding protein